MENVAVLKIAGQEVALPLNAKQFSTGSRGFHASGKVQTEGGKYQVNVLAVLIGSKPVAEK